MSMNNNADPEALTVALSPENERLLQRFRQRLVEQQQQQQQQKQRQQQRGPQVATPRNGSESRRKDLSGEYQRGRGELPVERLGKELELIVEEHENYDAQSGDDCWEHKSRLAAPFLCAFQSTGYGKTRAVMELAKKKKLVYFLLKDQLGSWRVPEVVRKFLVDVRGLEEDSDRIEKKWMKFFDAVKICAGRFRTPKDLYDAQITEDWAFGRFFGQLDEVLREQGTPQENPMRQENRLPSAMRDPKSPPERKKVRFSYIDSVNITKESLVVCFDEASGLKDCALLTLRRAAKHLGVLCIFADTATSICKVMNPNDHSSNAKGGILGRFVAPIYGFPGDLTWDRAAAYDDYENLFCAGRPRWRSYINICKAEPETEGESIHKLIALAENLLTQEAGVELEGGDKTLIRNNNNHSGLPYVSPSMIAIFSCRFSLGPCSKISYLLVKHSLATVIGVSEDRSLLCSSYPSEPLLSEASARYTKDKNNLRSVLQHVKAAVHRNNGILDPPRGDVGEMCAAALLGYAMDHIRLSEEHEYMSQTVELTRLLSLFSCFPDGTSTNDEANRTILDLVEKWNVNFTHFVPRGPTPTENDLEVMWLRRMAYYVPDGAKGLDLLIAMQDENKKCGTLRVQVKNYTNKISKSERLAFLQKLLPSKCPPKVAKEGFSVGLLLSVDSIDDHCELLSGAKHNRHRSGRELESPVLQLATCFPCQKNSPLSWLSSELMEICSQNTRKPIYADNIHEVDID